MKTMILYLSLVVILFTSSIVASSSSSSSFSSSSSSLSCTHVFDVSNGQCYKFNNTIDFDTKVKVCFDRSISPSSPSSSSFTLASSTTECGISASEEFTNSLYLPQSGTYVWVATINDVTTLSNKQTQFSNLIFSTLESASTIELTIDSTASSLSAISQRLPTIEMLSGKLVLKSKSCSLVRSFVHCGAQNSTSKKLASTNWDEHFDEETCTLVCEPLVVPPPPFPSFDFPLNNDEEDFGHLVRRATCTTTISTSTWSAFNSAISALANNGILCLNVGTITKSTGDTTIILPSSKTITIMSIKSGGTTLSASGTFGSRLFQGPSSTTIVTFDGITFGPHSQSLNSQGAIYLAGPATFTNCKFVSLQATVSVNGLAISSTDSLVLTGCTFISNSGTSATAVVYSTGGLTVTSCTFTGNTVGSSGMIYTTNNALITGSTFSSSSSGGTMGSAVSIQYSTTTSYNATISKSTFTNNVQTNTGAANAAVIYISKSGNSATQFAIASLTLQNSGTPNAITISGSAGSITYTPFNTCNNGAALAPNVVSSGSFSFTTNTAGNFYSSFCATCTAAYPGNAYCNSMSSTINCANIPASTETKSTCVSSCVAPLFNAGTSCESICPISSYAKTETGICGEPSTCSGSKPFANSNNRFCVKCAVNTYYNSVTSSCGPVATCPVSAPYGDTTTGYCVATNGCSAYAPYLNGNLCVVSCPAFYYLVGNVCTPCSTTVSCTQCYTSLADWTAFTATITNAVAQDVLCYRLASPVTRPNTASSITISKALIIAHLTVQGDGVSSSTRAFTVSSSSVTINWVDVTFKNFFASSSGAVLYQAAGTTTFTNCQYLDNTVTGDSNYGALYVVGGTATFNNCQFLRNTATGSSSSGSAVYTQGTSTVATFNGCTFTNNSLGSGANNRGGAVLAYQAACRFTDCTFFGNTAGKGGALSIENGNSWVKNCSFTNNYCQYSATCGSAVYVSPYSSLTTYYTGFAKSTFSGNYCQSSATTSSVIAIESTTSKTLNLGLASTSFGGVSNPIYVSLTNTAGVLNLYTYNICSYSLYSRNKGTVNTFIAGTNAVSGTNNFCSTCGDVFTNSEYCKLMNSTIDCASSVSTEPTSTLCTCSGSVYRDDSGMNCVTAANCPASVPFGNPVNHVCTNALGCSETVNPYGDPINHICTSAAGCAATTNSFADSSTHLCTAPVDCSSSVTPFRNSISNTCVNALGCSATSNSYGDISSHTCVSTCPSGTVGDSLSHLCCNSCPSEFYLLPGTCTTFSVGQCASKPQACSIGGGSGLCTCSGTTIDCTGLSLDEMPSFTNVPATVTELKVGGNDFSSVPSYSFSGLTSVTKVTLSSNVNKVNYGAFLGMLALTTIDFSNNQLTSNSFGPGAFYGAPEGVTVNFAGNTGLTSAPPSTYEDGGSILPCHRTCKTCFGAGSGSCCPENCLVCSDSTTCTTCYDGFTKNGDGVCVSDLTSLTCSSTNKPLTNGIAVLDKFPINSIKYGRGCFIDSSYAPLFSGFSVSNTASSTDYCCKKGSEGVISEVNGIKFCQFGCSGFEKTLVNYAWVNGAGPNDGDNIGSRCYADCFIVY